jgi:type I restriction enzyme S subunit
LSNLIAPLPPFEEQNRIVAKIYQLMSLCDELEAGLMRSQADSEKLMEAVVGRMLAGGDNA